MLSCTVEGGMPPGDAITIKIQSPKACLLVVSCWLGAGGRVDWGGRAENVMAAWVVRDTAVHICPTAPSYQCQEPRTPNKTSGTIPSEALFLSTGALVFRRVGSGRTRRSTNR